MPSYVYRHVDFMWKSAEFIRGTRICPVVTPGTGAFFNKGVTKAMEGGLAAGHHSKFPPKDGKKRDLGGI